MVFGRLARTPLEIDLGLPLTNPGSQHEYSESVRSKLKTITELARRQLKSSRANQRQVDSTKDSNWTPLAVGRSVWLRRPKTWKFGRRWIGPYQIISHQGVNYKLCSREGKDIVVHHNNVKPCTIPFNMGEPSFPVREAEEMEIVHIPGEELQAQHLPLRRPARLRQTIQPPLRFGDFVSH